jgi:(R,R)-butanediol dehydrogenase/meso-butanediol dehydrogenase/diacetyl reductase
MRGVVWNGEDAEVVDTMPPRRPENSVRVDVHYVGLCGTDLHILHGSHPRAVPGLLMGHEFVGRLSLDNPMSGWRDGQAVFVNPLVEDGTCPTCAEGLVHLCPSLSIIGVDAPGALTASVHVPVSKLVALPDRVDLLHAAIIEPLSTAVRAVRRSGLSRGDRVHIVGFGPIGNLVAQLVRHAGAAHVSVAELSAERSKAARGSGFPVVPAPATPVDLIFDCVGHPSVAEKVTTWAKPGGTIVVVGMYAGMAQLNLLDITMRELSIIGSKAYTPLDVDEAVALLAQGVIDLDHLVSSVISLDDVPQAFARMHAGTELKVLVDVIGTHHPLP